MCLAITLYLSRLRLSLFFVHFFIVLIYSFKYNILNSFRRCLYPPVSEQKARTTYDNILRFCDDPDVRDPIKFLRAREIVHYQRFGEPKHTTYHKKHIPIAVYDLTYCYIYRLDFSSVLLYDDNKSSKRNGYMVSDKESSCPCCGGTLRYYDSVKRTMRDAYGEKRRVIIPRERCETCGHIYRNPPPYLLPRKQYPADVIFSFIHDDSLRKNCDYENYPCEATVASWRRQTLE